MAGSFLPFKGCPKINLSLRGHNEAAARFYRELGDGALYPFGWRGIMLNETARSGTPIKFTCVGALANADLW